MEGAFGAVGLVAGTLDGELGGATEAVVSVGDRVGGGQRQRGLVRIQRGQQPVGDRVVDGGRGHRAARRGGFADRRGASTRRPGVGRCGNWCASVCRTIRTR